jgi:radical SAM superfamily enzyme YgiQ (UPF0313 family)
MAPMTATVQTPQGAIDLATDLLHFSPTRCFAWGERCGRTRELYQALARALEAEPGPLALYGTGPFLEQFLEAAPGLSARLSCVVDPWCAEPQYAGLPVLPDCRSLPPGSSIFLCELRSEPRWRLRRELEPRFRVLCPDLLAGLSELVPPVAWVVPARSIYPLEIPSLEVRPDLDLLLLNLPARNNFALPLSMGYVHLALCKVPGLAFQTLDADSVLYHRFHIARLYDLAEPVVLENGRPLQEDPWDWNEECWMDPRLWTGLHALFSRDIDELLKSLVRARPRAVAFSVHQRNEWISRLVAHRLKQALPETLILAGGHSCVSPTLGPQAFPEFDYMVIGEAETVLGPLLLQLKAGARPGDLPGVVSRYDTPGHRFTHATPEANLDAIGAPAFDFLPDFRLFQTSRGGVLPYLNLTRGCIWGRCTFCAERFPFRSRSARAFVDDLERFCQMGLHNFNFSESDFGGRPEVLEEVADEILRRGLKVQLTGQLRVNPRHDLPFLRKLVAAGIVCNFGIDGMTPHTLKLQRKGYSIETVKTCLENCREAGIRVVVNLVVGVPGETEEDVEETIRFIVDHKSYISEVFNISPFNLMHGCIYWEEPERHGIRFLGDREELYLKYGHGIPDRYWYSVEPYLDGALRRQRALRIMNELRRCDIPVSYFAEASIMLPMYQGFQNLRDLVSEVPSLAAWDLPAGAPPLPRQLTDQLRERTVVGLSGRWLAFRNSDIPALQRASGSISVHP